MAAQADTSAAAFNLSLRILVCGHRRRWASGAGKKSLRRRGGGERSGMDAVGLWWRHADRNAAGRFYQVDKTARQGAYRSDLHDRNWVYDARLRIQCNIGRIGARLRRNRRRAIEHNTDGVDTRMHRAANARSSDGFIHAWNIGA